MQNAVMLERVQNDYVVDLKIKGIFIRKDLQDEIQIFSGNRNK